MKVFFFFTHDVVKRRAPFFTRMQEKSFTFRNAKRRRRFVSYCAFRLRTLPARRPFGTISSDVKRCQRGGNLGSVCREGGGNRRALPFYERSRCSIVLETATRVALRSRESWQEVAHFRCQDRKALYFTGLLNFVSRTRRFPGTSGCP